MSVPAFGISSWRKRSPSLVSRTGPEDIPGQMSSSNPQSRPVHPDARLLSSSVSSTNHREPTRSFVPGSAREHLCKSPANHAVVRTSTNTCAAPIDSASYARSVRADTAELASYVLSDKKDKRSASFLRRRPSGSSYTDRESSLLYRGEQQPTNDDSIAEVSEPSSPDTAIEDIPDEGPSIIASMLKQSPPDIDHASEFEDSTTSDDAGTSKTSSDRRPSKRASKRAESLNVDGASESTPLLIQSISSYSRPPESPSLSEGDDMSDVESQKPRIDQSYRGYASIRERAKARAQVVSRFMNPKTWDRHVLWQNAVVKPVKCLPSVIVGLLLNILDALSYGMILFPLGNPVFANLGPAGISIFYVSTIVSQLVFSAGSIFKGGIGSELIEVVPFFHSMAATITSIVGEDNPDAVIATTITSYALSSMLTGLVFWLMGKFRLGYIIGFIPRHILIGCIGGVGWFLIQTGFEVSARLEEFQYDLDTLHRLGQPGTLPLWIIPLALAIILFGLQRKITSQYFLSVYILTIPFVFYFFVLSIDELVLENLRDHGWIFEAPNEGEPWYHFWTLYKFHLVHWGAIFECTGAMFALTFFSLLHVPINVPALAQSTGEDNADLNHELKLHGYSNFLSGCAGSIQNYLVYANTLFFMRSGGDNRLAGVMLAALTAVILVVGPKLIGFIPVMMVGTLIFVLGFELISDALIAPRRKLKMLEYLTILAIVLTMGIYDFVAGIFLGIILAFVSVIVHQSGVSAIRACYTGDQVGSMVRRNPSQHHYLQEVGRQTYIIKLVGNLFFGTIVGVQEKIRTLIADDVFAAHPIKYLIIDLWQVTGIDYSAAEGFMTISRLLHKKGVVLRISGKDAESKVGRDLRAVGLGDDGPEVMFMPDLNSALESCENEQLKTFYAQQEAIRMVTRPTPSENLEVPSPRKAVQALEPREFLSQSPRRIYRHEVAKNVLIEHETKRASRWRNINEPLRLMLQIFHDLSDKNEDFWFRAKPYFVQREYPADSVLYHRGEPANGFYLLERGELRADYETPQGKLSEPIVQGTTCGELPFFSQTDRTATVSAVTDCVVWVMDTESWERLRREQNDVYQELLSISLKLTTERMNAMTNYTLANAN
ncbi:putative Sulfate transporter family protein [Seiridium cardinale]|uniref:Sulfate transporter family protein n=1 Tax=Seiridium cardinale TaxID=138064 RepID=A0ABR2XC02_9PEZI